MAISSLALQHSLSSHLHFSTLCFISRPCNPPNFYSPYRNRKIYVDLKHRNFDSFRLSYRFSSEDSSEDDEAEDCSFDEAVLLFNSRDYYRCHDFLEALWNKAEEPRRTIIHGILQCAVGFHHLFNQNHRGAMMELGEGLCKLRKMNFETGPFHQFEREISAALDFIYHTQLEQAACTDDFCLAMDRSERSYQLLGGFAAGQRLYHLESDLNETLYIVFCPEGSYSTGRPIRVKVPTLHATEEHLKACEYN
ncbi:hypothetical protein HHK36_017024 [Tetracentron sinense]|uniref:DUF309 domain-containing protein n=1 Tax=Tetracentron sinense TaxID=13715 RepID=A0A835DC50_TETSI|nr:hypothetical protein HHK36_017024 [Tetracentron sinense]